MASAINPIVRAERGSPHYPTRLGRLGADTPASVALHGNATLLREPIVALFCSIRVPGSAVVSAYDLAREYGASRRVVASGFQSPLERDFLDYLLRGSASAIVCPARGLEGMHAPKRWGDALAEGRLLWLSTLREDQRRATRSTADIRNRVVAALADRVLVLHASSGGRLARLAREALGWGTVVECLDHPSNEDLRICGARSIPGAGAVPSGGG